MSIPDTRPSLLLRLHDSQDREAWEEFVAIYQPVVQRMATRRGMQPADAEDLTQQVLLTISRAIDRFEPDATRGRFRTWLRTIAHRAIVNAMTRRQADRGLGGEAGMAILMELQEPSPSDLALDQEYRKELFLVAAAQVRDEILELHWRCFWETSIRGRSVREVADEFECSPGTVYIARCRVMKRLKAKVQWLDLEGGTP